MDPHLMPVYFPLLLFFVVVVTAIYDLKYRKVPNWLTLPLMLIGFSIVGLPGNFVVWIGSAFVFQAWKLGMIGGGDAKLWVGLLWCLFYFAGEQVLLIMCVTLLVTGLAQIIIRALIKKKIEIGIKVPGVWRAVVFMGCLVFLTPK
jgi:Flp pilus assembly protein protease CpaA